MTVEALYSRKVQISGPKKTRIDPITAKRPKAGQMGKLLVEGCEGIRNRKPPLMKRIMSFVLPPKEEKPKEVSMLNYMFGREDVSTAQHLIEAGAVIKTLLSCRIDKSENGIKTRKITDIRRYKRLKTGSKEADEKMRFMLIDGGDNFEVNMHCGPYEVSKDEVSPMLVGFLNFNGEKINSNVPRPSINTVAFVIELTKDGKTADMLRKIPHRNYWKKEITGRVEAVEKALEAGDMEKVRALLKAEKPKPYSCSASWAGGLAGAGILGPNDREI